MALDLMKQLLTLSQVNHSLVSQSTPTMKFIASICDSVFPWIRSHIPAENLERWIKNKLQLRNPRPPDAAGRNRRNLHLTTILRHSGHPRRPILLRLSHCTRPHRRRLLLHGGGFPFHPSRPRRRRPRPILGVRRTAPPTLAPSTPRL